MSDSYYLLLNAQLGFTCRYGEKPQKHTQKKEFKMEPMVRFELTTDGLRNRNRMNETMRDYTH